MKQRTEAWLNKRGGRFSGSEVYKLFSSDKVKLDYIFAKAKELLFGLDKSYTNVAMQWGIDHEPTARFLFELETGLQVKETGFFPYGPYGGGSPDGVIDENAIIEIKCPYSYKVHQKYTEVRTAKDLRKAERKYWYQVMNNMEVTGADICFFISWWPDELHFAEIKREEFGLIESLNKAGDIRDCIIQKITQWDSN